MAEIVAPALPESPVAGSSYVGTAVAGTAFGTGNAGVSGSSVPPPLPPGVVRATPASNLMGDGVYGSGLNGVHGMSAYNNGVLGENSDRGAGVTGQSQAGHGVHGVNGAGANAAPKFGCGMLGESENGYGLYGASKTASGVYGTSGSGHLAGEFAGDVDVTGTLTATSAAATGVHGTNGSGAGAKPKFGCGVLGESDNGYGLYGASKTASGVYGTSGSGHLAGEFDGKVGVTGDVSVTGDISVTGNLKAADVILSGADCAEEFDTLAVGGVEPGTVVVLGAGGQLTPSTRAYDRKVAGVISGAGSFRPGVVLDRRVTDRTRAPVALVGKVFCKVDATDRPIQVGDLLTTSFTLGCAMKAEDPLRAFGAIIGKALGELDDGIDLIPMLVAMA
jgi:cytoskeletal protein CcmA (bactofilin family)